MNATLLVAERQSPSRDLLERFLSRSGFRVETASDALECLGKVRSLEPAVLVLDVELPWGGAAAVVAFLNESHFEFQLPAVLITGDAPPAVLSEWTAVPNGTVEVEG